MLLKIVNSFEQDRINNDYYLDEELQDISEELDELEDSIENIERPQHIAETATQLGRQTHINDKTDSKYEITENVIDVPNNMTIAGPIITNYTITKPLNALPNNTTNSIDLNSQTNKENAAINPKKHTFSIFHVKAEFEDSKPNHPNIDPNGPAQVYHYNNINLREYLDGIKRGLARGINSLININREYDVKKGVYVPNVIVTSPVKYLQTLQKKGEDVVREYHDVVFG